MTSESIGNYEEFLKYFLKTFAKVKDEELKRNGFKIIRYYMTCLYLEVIAPIEDIRKKEDILLNMEIFPEITDAICNDFDNYHEGVKEEV